MFIVFTYLLENYNINTLKSLLNVYIFKSIGIHRDARRSYLNFGLLPVCKKTCHSFGLHVTDKIMGFKNMQNIRAMSKFVIK